MLKSTLRSGWSRLILAVLGSLIYALGVNLFVTPLGLYTGGLMGICQLLRTLILSALHVSSLPFDLAGVVFYAINVPLLAIAWRFMGPIFFRNTVICATTYTLFVSLVPVPARPLVDDAGPHPVPERLPALYRAGEPGLQRHAVPPVRPPL